ncbi:hypothetical protein ACJX0J_028544, partial [Zea mays]
WQLPNEQPNYLASTANERRRDRAPPPLDPENLKAVIAGYSQIGKAFITATFMVFGGATAVLLYTADKLQLHSVDDVKTKGKDALQPRADMIKEQIAPLRSWSRSIFLTLTKREDKQIYFDCKTPKIFKTVKPAILYGAEYWPNKRHVQFLAIQKGIDLGLAVALIKEKLSTLL